MLHSDPRLPWIVMFWQIKIVLILWIMAFKARLDVALGSLVWWLVTLRIAGGWNKMIIVVLFNPGHSMILLTFWWTKTPLYFAGCKDVQKSLLLSQRAHPTFSACFWRYEACAAYCYGGSWILSSVPTPFTDPQLGFEHIPWKHKMVWVGRDPKSHQVQPLHWAGTPTAPSVLRAPPAWPWVSAGMGLSAITVQLSTYWRL